MSIQSAKRNKEIEQNEADKKDLKSPATGSSSRKKPMLRSLTSQSTASKNNGSANGKSAVSTSHSPEEDGEAIKTRPSFWEPESSEEDGESAAPDWWNERCKQDSAYYEEIAIKRAIARERNTPPWPEKPVDKVSDQKSEKSYQKSESKNKSTIQRSQTIHLVGRDSSKRLSIFSKAQESSPDLSLGMLAEGEWVSSSDSKSKFSVADKIPKPLRRELARQYSNFTSLETSQNLRGEEREAALRKRLALRFLSEVLMGKDSQFDQTRLKSRTAINNYLSKTYGFQISRGAETSQSSSGSRNSTQEKNDVISLLIMDALLLSKNYRVDYSIDLGDLDADPFVKKTYLSTLEAARNNQVVSDENKQRDDVSGIFVRDFGKSVYEIEDENGKAKPIGSVDEFVEFIGDPAKCNLPWGISVFACQTLPIFIKNLLFTRTNSQGKIDSPLKLYDGSPVAFSVSPKAIYRLKKYGDGKLVLSYRGEYDAADAKAQGKNTASILTMGEKGVLSKAVLIDEGKATISLDITFQLNADFKMGTLQLSAEGWNFVSE